MTAAAAPCDVATGAPANPSQKNITTYRPNERARFLQRSTHRPAIRHMTFAPVRRQLAIADSMPLVPEALRAQTGLLPHTLYCRSAAPSRVTPLYAGPRSCV